MTGQVSGAGASTHDSRHSTGVRSVRKRKSVEQGTVLITARHDCVEVFVLNHATFLHCSP